MQKGYINSVPPSFRTCMDIGSLVIRTQNHYTVYLNIAIKHYEGEYYILFFHHSAAFTVTTYQLLWMKMQNSI